MLKSVVTLIFVFCVSITLAQGKVDLEFKQQLEALSGKNETISCLFSQTKQVKNIKQPINSNGRFFYDRSGQIALLYDIPNGDKVIMNNESFIIVTSGKAIISDASANPMMSQISHMMQACMSGDVSKLGRGWTLDIYNLAEVYKIKLTPSDHRVQRYISSMSMIFDRINMTLNELRIDETSGGYTKYSFTNKKLNQKIDKAVFRHE